MSVASIGNGRKSLDDDHSRFSSRRNRSLSDPINGIVKISTDPQKPIEPLKGYLVENFAIQEEVASTYFSKVFKVKRHSDNKYFLLRCTAQSFDGSAKDIAKSDVLCSEMILFYKCRHKNVLQGEACWLEIYDMDQTGDTPSIAQPFNLYDLIIPHDFVVETANDNDDDDDYHLDAHAKTFLSAIFENESKSRQLFEESDATRGRDSEKVVVVFTLLEYASTTLADILEDKGFQLTEDDKWHIGFHLTSILYFFHRQKHLHLALNCAHIFIDNSGTSLMPKLLDHGVKSERAAFCTDYAHSDLPYLPPERASQCSHIINSSSDIFSLGLIFLQLFAHPANCDLDRVYEQLLQGNTECLSQIVLPSDVVFLLEQMLAADPAERPDPSEILDYMVPFVDVEFGFDAEEIQRSIEDRSHSDMLTQLVQTILYVEFSVVEANLRFKKWLSKIPENLCEAILQKRAKYEAERLLVKEIGSEATRVDVEFILGKFQPIFSKSVERDLSEKETFKLVVALVFRRYQLDGSSENPDVVRVFEKLQKLIA